MTSSAAAQHDKSPPPAPLTAEEQALRYGITALEERAALGVTRLYALDQKSAAAVLDHIAHQSAEIARLEARVAELDHLRESAANWEALRNCARMTTLGSAGIHPMSDSFSAPDGHLTLNLWTHTRDGWGLGASGDSQDMEGRRDLDTFVRKARAVMP